MASWASRWAFSVVSAATFSSKLSSPSGRPPCPVRDQSVSGEAVLGVADAMLFRPAFIRVQIVGPGIEIGGGAEILARERFGERRIADRIAASDASPSDGPGSASSRSSSGLRSSSPSTYSPSSRLDNCSSLIACCNCGVMTRDWPCFSSRRWLSAMRPSLPA